MAKYFYWLKGKPMPLLQANATPNTPYKLECQKSPYSGVEQYYWNEDTPINIMDYFEPCSMADYMEAYRSTYGPIGGTVYIYSAPPSTDIVYKCRIVRTLSNYGPSTDLDILYYQSIANMMSARVSDTGALFAGYTVEGTTATAGQVLLMLTDASN